MLRARTYGWKPDLPDFRDRLYAKVARPHLLPPSVDLRAGCPPVVDQGELGACTGNAIAAAIGYLELKDGVPLTPVSRLFIYYNERSIEGTVGEDSGAQIRDGIKSVKRWGACAETDWPYDIAQFTTQPPAEVYTAAALHKVTQYERIEAPNELKQCLASGFPFVMGFTVYDSFETDAVAATGTVPMPGPDDQVLGGHAVLAVGYDDHTKRYTLRNSWGPDWGAAGYFTLPYDYVHNTNLSTDFWSIRRETGF